MTADSAPEPSEADLRHQLFQAAVTQTIGDPTYSILKAHLLFEELIRDYLAMNLKHPAALGGARLSFSQRLAMAQAISVTIPPEHFVWEGIRRLNVLRNIVGHEAEGVQHRKIDEYVTYVVTALGKPLPLPSAMVAAAPLGVRAPIGVLSPMGSGPYFFAIDMANSGLYSVAGFYLGMWK